MALLTDAAKAYIGIESTLEWACDPVERGAVRRYAQAIMDEDPIYQADNDTNQRYGGAVAPPLFPSHLFRRAFGTTDPIQDYAADPHFDGAQKVRGGLPEIEPLKHLAVMNGGSEIEFYRYACYQERVKLRSRYADIVEKESSKGPIILVYTETDYLTANDELLMRVRHTRIRRPL